MGKKENKKNLPLRGRQKFKMESFFFEREDKRREIVKNVDERGIRIGTMVIISCTEKFWNIIL